MHKEAHRDDFENELEYENVTEDGADLLKSLVVFRLVISIAEISACQHERVKKDGEDDERLEAVTVREAHDEVATLCVVVEDEEGATVVDDDVRLRLPVRVLALASIEESIALQIKDAFNKVGRLVYLWLLILKQIL